MDMDFRGNKKKSPFNKDNQPKELPGFRAGSELPEHSDISEENDPIADAFSDQNVPTSQPIPKPNDEDPTDLMLEREKSATQNQEDQTRPYMKAPKAKNKKKHIIILLAILFAVLAAAGGWYATQKLQEKNDKAGDIDTVASQSEPVKTEPTTVASPMTGLEVSPEIAKKQVTAIMIENSVDARPQAGLTEADMVFEAVAEGGITRFVALYQDSSPDHVGPIRSARPYYVEIARSFDAAFVHAGGSPDGLAKISELGVKDMSAFEENGTYTRVNYRSAPHNLYSSIEKLNSRQTVLGFNESTYTPWLRKNETPQTPVASNINFSLSGVLYNPTFAYDATTNSYLRSQDGSAHTDEKTSKQINPKVVVGLVTSKGQEGIYSTYRLTGSGEIRVFQDGIISEGTWTRESATAQFSFKDKNGLAFQFNKGQIWVTLVGSTGNITTSQ